MKTPLHDASARQHPGEPLGANHGRKDRLRGLALVEVDGEIAELIGQSTQELRRGWRRLHHTGPPLGLSRDLIIRGLADQLCAACFYHHWGERCASSSGGQLSKQSQRRRLLGRAGATVLAAVLGQPASAAEIAQQEARLAQAKSAAAPFGTRLLLLGTAGGPTYWPNINRRSTSSALVVGDRWFESISPHERVSCKPGSSGEHPIDDRRPRPGDVCQMALPRILPARDSPPAVRSPQRKPAAPKPRRGRSPPRRPAGAAAGLLAQLPAR